MLLEIKEAGSLFSFFFELDFERIWLIIKNRMWYVLQHTLTMTNLRPDIAPDPRYVVLHIGIDAGESDTADARAEGDDSLEEHWLALLDFPVV